MRPESVPLLVLLLGIGSAVIAPLVRAQPTVEAPPPPRIIETDESGGETGRPGEAALASLPPERREALEEVVVVGSGGWRLPELGSDVETAQDEPPGRISMDVLPLYDPDSALDLSPSLFDATPPAQRIGYLELFRVRFGEAPD